MATSTRSDEQSSTRRRREALDALRAAGREHSDATVIFHSAVAARLGLNPTDSKTMGILQRRGPLTAGQIAHETRLTTASVTALVDRLERRGMVRRLADPTDRRRVIVAATDEGIDRFAPLFAAAQRSLGRLFEPYTTEELDIILDFLGRSTARLRDETEKLRQMD